MLEEGLTSVVFIKNIDLILMHCVKFVTNVKDVSMTNEENEEIHLTKVDQLRNVKRNARIDKY